MPSPLTSPTSVVSTWYDPVERCSPVTRIVRGPGWLTLTKCGSLSGIATGDKGAALLEGQEAARCFAPRPRSAGRPNFLARVGQKSQKASKTCPESGSWGDSD